MRKACRGAIVGALILGAPLVAAAQNAQIVPIPLPAPLPKTQDKTQDPIGAAIAQDILRPPAAVPAAPSTTPAITGSTVTPPKPAAPVVVQNTKPAAPVRGPVRPGGSTAFDSTQRALVDRVSTYLSGLQQLVGRFVQIAPDGSRTQGDFYLQKPGKVRFEYDPPSVIQLISDGQSLVVRDRKLATQDLYPLSQTPLRLLLAERIDLLRDTNLVSVSADDVFVSVAIEEKQTFGGTHRLMLMFNAQDFQLKQWTITDPQGYDTTVAVYNLDTSKRPDPGLFKIDYTRYN